MPLLSACFLLCCFFIPLMWYCLRIVTLHVVVSNESLPVIGKVISFWMMILLNDWFLWRKCLTMFEQRNTEMLESNLWIDCCCADEWVMWKNTDFLLKCVKMYSKNSKKYRQIKASFDKPFSNQPLLSSPVFLKYRTVLNGWEVDLFIGSGDQFCWNFVPLTPDDSQLINWSYWLNKTKQ